jgi:Mg/Co/Ni transporter MgtE
MATPVSRIGDTPSAAPTVGAQANLRALAGTAIRSARDVVARLLEIAALESRVAGMALTKMAAAAITAVVLGLTTWGLLVAAAVYALIAAGVSVGTALLLAALGNLIAAAVLVVLIPRMARRLTFPATRRVLEKIGPSQ